MAIEIVSEEGKSSLISKIFSAVAFLAVLLSAGAFLYLRFVAIPSGEKKIANLNMEIANQTSSGLSADIMLVGKEVRDYKLLLNNRAVVSKFFYDLGTWTHPQIFISGIDLDVGTRTATMSGVAAGFQPLIQQIAFFSKQPLIESYNVSNVKMGTGGTVNFDLALTVKQEVLKETSN
ncbi:MAG: hypothetical protein PHG23_02650 [Candidatus Pacebacteria bacterium]|nr:hypothetical protein [Candidatus Paceibacterota bacterium]